MNEAERLRVESRAAAQARRSSRSEGVFRHPITNVVIGSQRLMMMLEMPPGGTLFMA
jgi:hypothetical protein